LFLFLADEAFTLSPPSPVEGEELAANRVKTACKPGENRVKSGRKQDAKWLKAGENRAQTG